MKGQAVVHSKGKDDWETPAWLFEYFNTKYNFGLDAAASLDNALCKKYFTEEDDALKQSWRGYGNVFVNPPYSLNQKFIEKIIDELDGIFTVCALVPSRTDTRWFHDLVLNLVDEIWFIRGRLKFSNSENSAPFPSCVLIFKNPFYDVIKPLFKIPEIYSLEKPKDGRYKSTFRRDTSNVRNNKFIEM